MYIRSLALSVLTGIAGCGSAQNPVADASITIRVVNQDGLPIQGAEVRGGFEYSYYDGDSYSEITDSNGCIRASGRLMASFNVFAKKDGYYETSDVFRWKDKFPGAEIKNGRW